MAFSLLTYAALALTLYLTATLFSALRLRQANQQLARARNCLPPQNQLSELIFPLSLSHLFVFLRAASRKRHINLVSENFKRYGPTRVYSSLFDNYRGIVTCDPEIIKTVLATSFHDFALGPARHEAFSPLLGDGIFTTDGPVWEHARALLRPQFTKDQIADLEDLEIHVQNLLAVLNPLEGQTVGLHKLFLNLTLDSSTAFLLGHSVYSLRNKVEGVTLVPQAERDANAKFEEDFDYCQNALGFKLGVWEYRWLYHPWRLPGAIARVHGLVDQFVELAIRNQQKDERKDMEYKSGTANEGRKYVFLDALAQDTQDPKIIRDQLLSALLAGRDTTATLLAWIFWLFAKHPAVMQKLRADILNTIGRKKPTYQQLKDATYLKWVINETLRLFPIVPINFRSCIRNTTLPLGGGPDGRSPIFVPVGSRVVYSVYALHRRRDIYGEDADEFRPERWGDGKGRAWEWIPFNGGPRICIGQQLALVTASYVVVRLLQEFENVESVAGGGMEDIKTNLGLTLSPADGAEVRMFKDKEAR